VSWFAFRSLKKNKGQESWERDSFTFVTFMKKFPQRYKIHLGMYKGGIYDPRCIEVSIISCDKTAQTDKEKGRIKKKF